MKMRYIYVFICVSAVLAHFILGFAVNEKILGWEDFAVWIGQCFEHV
jgi:hypothetical protein